MPVLHAAVCCRFWLPGVACCLPAVLDVRHCFGRPPTVLAAGVASRLPAVLDACRRSLRFGTGELRSAPALPFGPAPSFAPEPLRPHPYFILAPLRNHSQPYPGLALEPLRPHPDFIPAPPRNHHRTRSRAGRTSCAGEAAVDKLSKTLAGNLPQSPRNRLFL